MASGELDAFSGPVQLFVRYFRYNAVNRSASLTIIPLSLPTSRVRAVEVVSLGNFLGMEGWLEFHPWLPPSQG
ncbi:hypothetical protein AVEN_163552-1, partial [Araneus ventricosus]